MSKPPFPSGTPLFGSPRRIEVLGLYLAAMLVAACSFDAGKLRAPGGKGRDAAAIQSGTLEVAAAAEDVGAGQPDLHEDTFADAPTDLYVRTEGPSLTDLVGEEPGLDQAGQDSGTVALDVRGMGGVGGVSGGTGGEATGGAGGASGIDTGVEGATPGAGGAVGMDGNPDGLVGDVDPADVNLGAGGATGGTDGDGAGEAGTGGTDGIATGGAGGVNHDVGFSDAPNTYDVAPDGDGDEVGTPSVDPYLVLWYRFDESNGVTAYDSVAFGGVSRDAMLVTPGSGGSATFSTTKQVGTHALLLAPSSPSYSNGGYVVMPTLHDLAPAAITIAVWLRLNAATLNQNWERVFDYGDSTTGPRWFNLAARNGTTPYGPIFAISNTGHNTSDQQRLISSTALEANVWHHVAIVLQGDATYTGFMYIDGVVVASNNAMTLHLSDIGATTNNWLGRSEFTSDPYFDGSMDDLRVYRRALLQQEITTLATR